MTSDDALEWARKVSEMANEGDNLPMIIARQMAYHAGHAVGQSEAEARVAVIREQVARLHRASGCSCCRDDDAWDEAEKALAELLAIPEYADGSGYDFSAAIEGRQP